MILDKSWDHPSNPLFKELIWLPLQSVITYHVALLIFKKDILYYVLYTTCELVYINFRQSLRITL